MPNIQVYLASKSPRRRELLQQIGLKFESLEVDVDEQIITDELADQYVARLAIAKAEAGSERIKNSSVPVIGSDTCIWHEGRIIGKPSSKSHALKILQELSGTNHEVYTGVAISNGESTKSIVQCSRVTLASISETEMEAYWTTGEPQDKAGAYAIQGLGAIFISQLEGSYSGIMGLPLYETAQLLKQFDIHCI